MNIVDTNAVSHVLEHNLRVRKIYYLPPDVREETQITEVVHGRSLSANFKDATSHWLFDGATYIRHYKDLLNRHSGRSFYNMTGFGDISILALIATVRDASLSTATTLFSKTEETITVITQDRQLITKIKQEFVSTTSAFKVQILGNAALT